MSRLRRSIGPIIVIVAILTLGSGIYLRISSGTDDSESEPTAEGEAPETSASTGFNTTLAIPVSGAPVVQDTLVISVTAAAQAAAWRQTQVLAQIGGQVTNLPVRENQTVRRGQLLLAVDTTDVALQVAQARAELASAEADYRERTLFDDQIEDAEIRAERDRVARAKSGVDRSAVIVQQRELDVARSRTRAPFGGRVADIRVVEGQMLRQGDEILTLVDISQIKVEVQVLESEVGFLREGGSAAISFAAFPDEIFTGTIATINPIIDRTTRTSRVTVTVPNAAGRILPGMYARVSLEAQRFADRILVHKSAILERDNRTMLFVYEQDGRSGLAKWHYVTTGLENDSLIEIVENRDTDMLEPGQVVLTDGHYSLIHDAVVRVVSDVRAAGGRPQ